MIFSLMVNECLIVPLKARTTIAKSNEAARNAYVQRSVERRVRVDPRLFTINWAILKKDSTGLKNAYGNLLHTISLERERKKGAGSLLPRPGHTGDCERGTASAERRPPTERCGAENLRPAIAKVRRSWRMKCSGTIMAAKLRDTRCSSWRGSPTLTGKMEEARVSFEQGGRVGA